jgi:hypothetical protein
MRESWIMETSVVRLAVKLLVVLVLLGGPLVQSLQADVVVGDGSLGHHALADSDEHSGKHHQALEMSGGEQVDDGIEGRSNDIDAGECCDLFCVGSACGAAWVDLFVDKPQSARTVVVNADIAPGEWVTPHRPPNA